MLFEETSGISRSYIRLPAKKSVRRATREQISPLSKQLLGIAVTQRGSGPYYGRNDKERTRVCVARGVESWKKLEMLRGMKSGGGVEEANAPMKKIKSCRTRHFEFFSSESRGGGGGGGTSVSGQSVDKRVVRTVLNRSEYLYTRVLSLRTFFCRCRRRLPRVSTFASDIFLITRS